MGVISLEISSAIFPLMRLAFHSTSCKVVETTYLGRLFPRDAQRDGRAFPVLRMEKWDGKCPVFRVELKKNSMVQR
jgi:hypothetical protein